MLIDRNTPVPLGAAVKAVLLTAGCVLTVGMAVWWAGSLSNEVVNQGEDIVEIKDELKMHNEKLDRIAERVGAVQIRGDGDNASNPLPLAGPMKDERTINSLDDL